MKKIFLAFLLGTFVMGAVGFKTVYQQKNSTADAVMIKDLLIFTDCKPVTEYVVIGNLKTSIISYNDETYIDGRNNLIEKCKENYPTAQGLIFTCKYSGSKYSADIITFK